MRLSSVLATAGLLSSANAAIKGFNYGATFNNNQAKTLVDFEYEFNAAKKLPGTNGWTSARLYTMIQAGTANAPISAIQAAINTKTTLLLGLWASAGPGIVNNEVAALKAAIAQYGSAFTDLVVGISVGSEDLYRITPTGIENNSGPGAQPQQLVSYIQQVRNAIRGTPLAGKPVGHVDTWTAYVNASNNAVISNLDFLGMDAYPYFQTTMNNDVGRSSQLFFDAYQQTVAASQGKPVWVTETGWPVTGQTLNQAVPSPDNARIFWEDVTCQLVDDNINLWYYILQDVQWGNPVPSFGIKPGGDLMQVSPLFDLSCPANAFARLLIAIDKTDPQIVVGNGFTVELSPTISTVLVYDVRPEFAGMTCTLALHIPPISSSFAAPVQVRALGGINVSRLDQTPNDNVNAAHIGSGDWLGTVTMVQPGRQYNIASFPCEAGQRIGYLMDSIGGLEMNWFQMVNPALGLFMLAG
ncbi:glycoside hydrolase [Decorospora gaudefroyi]|uniref:Probable glucan endo-1,3-beta-glucosidase eglC n=1 Tax=Decorospora gaudefroyi TaxID=184978 RepID=A0A6A5KG91_9PLEO|nr:glycoside hydrolase [Decorospora gaudefroyi]